MDAPKADEITAEMPTLSAGTLPIEVATDPDDSIASVPVEAPVVVEAPAEAAVAEDAVKVCSICGLDLSHKKRSRDSGGRYWCMHCHEFLTKAEQFPKAVPCPDCGRPSRHSTMVDLDGTRICARCNGVRLAEVKDRQLHKAAVTADPEVKIRRLIRQLALGIVASAAVTGLVTLYHFHLLYFRPRPWVPFISALITLGVLAVGLVVAIGVQYIRIALRKRLREIDYDKMVQTAINHILAVEDDSHALGISESPEPLRRRVSRSVARVEACAGQGDKQAAAILNGLAKMSTPDQALAFLLAQRPTTDDTVGRNREIAMLAYLHGNYPVASAAVTAILLRFHNDQEAMTRQALICFRIGELEKAKKIFRRVVRIAKEQNSEENLALAYSNLGLLHVMLNEWDDATNRYLQSLQIYKRLGRPDGEADCLMCLGLIAFRQKRDSDEVENYLRRSMAINKRHNREEGLSICCSVMGLYLIEKEPPQLNEAERLLKRAIDLNVSLGRSGGAAAAIGNLGLLQVKRGDLAAARQLFQRALGIYQRANRPKMALRIQGMLKTVGTLSAARGG
jgi:tetratricopeptide (TPR) repeat protein